MNSYNFVTNLTQTGLFHVTQDCAFLKSMNLSLSESKT